MASPPYPHYLVERKGQLGFFEAVAPALFTANREDAVELGQALIRDAVTRDRVFSSEYRGTEVNLAGHMEVLLHFYTFDSLGVV